MTPTLLTVMDKKSVSPVASHKGKYSASKGLKKRFLLRVDSFGIMVEEPETIIRVCVLLAQKNALIARMVVLSRTHS